MDQPVRVRYRRGRRHVNVVDACGFAMRAANQGRSGTADRRNRSHACPIVDALEFNVVGCKPELQEREQTALPPVFAAACVWGRRDAVKATLERIGALGGGDMSTIETAEGVLPSVLGPVPIPQPRTIDSRELEGTADRVKAVVRVPQSRRGELALRLRSASARHVAAREPGERVSSLIRRSESDARPLAVKN